MNASYGLRALGVSISWLLLVSCTNERIERIWLVDFAQPFPSRRADMNAFPSRYQGVYTAADSSKSLCIGRTAVWRQELNSSLISWRELAAQQKRLLADSTYQQDGVLHYLHRVGPDSVRDSWLECDTIFDCTKPETGRQRRFQGFFYLNTPTDSVNKWQVERLEISGRHLSWQALGQDTLRIRVLRPGTVHQYGSILYQLAPATAAEARRISRYEGLWETMGEYDRRH